MFVRLPNYRLSLKPSLGRLSPSQTWCWRERLSSPSWNKQVKLPAQLCTGGHGWLLRPRWASIIPEWSLFDGFFWKERTFVKPDNAKQTKESRNSGNGRTLEIRVANPVSHTDDSLLNWFVSSYMVWMRYSRSGSITNLLYLAGNCTRIFLLFIEITNSDSVGHWSRERSIQSWWIHTGNLSCIIRTFWSMNHVVFVVASISRM